MPSLPAETVDLIIDHLHDDRNALTACSLVAWQFVPTSRYHLFSDISLAPSRLCMFLKLLDVPSSTVGPAISRVRIQERKRTRSGRLHRPKYYVPTNPARVYACLQGVKSIHFSDIGPGDITPPFWKLLRQLKGVRELQIHQMTFDSPFQFFQYVCSYPSLEMLSLSKSCWDAVLPCNVTQFQAKTPFCVPLLDTTGTLAREILEWLLVQDPVPAANTLKLSLDGDSGGGDGLGGALQEYLDVAGPSVQMLHVSIPHSLINEDQPIIDLSSCNAISSIIFDGLYIGSRSHAQFASRLMQDLITTVASPYLSEVTLVLSEENSDDSAFMLSGMPDHVLVETFGWEAIVDVLQRFVGREKLRRLSVCLKGYPRFRHRHAEEFLRNGPLAVFDKAGVLKVEFPLRPHEEGQFGQGCC